MKYIDLFNLAYKDLYRNKNKTYLTGFSVIFPIILIVMIISISNGVKADMIKGYDKLSENFLFIAGPYNTNFIEFIKNKKSINFFFIDVNFETQLKFEKNKYNIKTNYIKNLIDSNKLLYLDDNTFIEIELLKGMKFTQYDIKNKLKLALIDEELSKDMFGGKDPIGENLIMDNGQKYKISGIIKKNIREENHFGSIFDMKKDITKKYNVILTYENDGIISDEVRYILDFKDYESNKIKTSINNFAKNEGFHISSITTMDTIKAQIDEVIGYIKSILILLSSVSVLIGIISVINVVLNKITDNKNNIGLFKAMGFQSKSIIIIYTIQGVILTFICTIIGIFLGYIISKGACTLFLEFNPILNIKEIIVMLAMSIISGIIAGIYPAYKTCKIEAIEIIKIS